MKRLATLAMALSFATPVFAQEGAGGGAMRRNADLAAVSPLWTHMLREPFFTTYGSGLSCHRETAVLSPSQP